MVDSGQEDPEWGWVLPGPTWGLSSVQDGGAACRGPLGRHLLWGPASLCTWAAMCPAPPSCHPGGKGGGERGKGPGPLDTQSFSPASGTGMGQRLTCASAKAPCPLLGSRLLCSGPREESDLPLRASSLVGEADPTRTRPAVRLRH